MSSTAQISDANIDLKFLNNADLRREICHMAQVTPEKDFYRNERNHARKFYSSERVGIIMYLLDDYDLGPDVLGSFTEEAIEEKLERCNGKTQNQIIDKLCDLEMHMHGQSNHIDCAARFKREELKALYRFLEEYNNE